MMGRLVVRLLLRLAFGTAALRGEGVICMLALGGSDGGVAGTLCDEGVAATGRALKAFMKWLDLTGFSWIWLDLD